MGNKCKSEDYLSATYKGVSFTQADVNNQYKAPSGDSDPVVYFRGTMHVFDFPKKDVKSLQIYSKTFKYEGKVPLNYKMNEIKTENTLFNEKFKIKSADEHEAFYVITPQLMEILIELQKNVFLSQCTLQMEKYI